MLMICQMIGLPPISIMGLGLTTVSSASLVPWPPANMTTFMPISNIITRCSVTQELIGYSLHDFRQNGKYDLTRRRRLLVNIFAFVRCRTLRRMASRKDTLASAAQPARTWILLRFE